MVTLSDVSGRSMKNSKCYSLTCILLQRIIRETFSTNTSITFDVCMLRHVAGLDMV